VGEGDIMQKIIKTADAPEAVGPYSQAVEAGGFIFISGQIPIDPKSGNLVKADIKIQTARILDNAKAILIAAGSTMSKVVKVTIYLTNMSDFSAMNDVYAGYFPTEPPARATVEVSRLPKYSAIEMDFVAVK